METGSRSEFQGKPGAAAAGQRYARIQPLVVGSGHEADAGDGEAWLQSMLPWHFQGDPLAEEVVRVLRRESRSMAQPALAVTVLAERGDTACQALLADMHAVPGWVDFALMKQGGAMAQRNFPALVMGLTYGCLPLTFAHPDAAAIFAGTGRMEASITRRLNESAALFFGVMDSDALAPQEPMWAACLQVRLVHAIVRMQALQQGWDVEQRGMPVSQLATAAGPAFFGSHLLEGMRRLGVKASEEEAAGFCMIWRYVTRLMGVPLALLGETQLQQDLFDQQMMRQFFAPDATAKTIMATLLEGLCSQRPTSRLPRTLQIALFRRMLGEEMADAFALPDDRAGRRSLAWLAPMLSGYSRLGRVPGFSLGTRWAGSRILDTLAEEGLIALAVTGGSR